ncbi:hypothetical protein PRLR5107_10520 [Prevotella lacticifex]|jgi:hypothetical protein|uniref:Uncharacterized protein n=1 Tax=Prevotella lacticifex TaxID=2854755 RepID=A0A9R1C9Q0_9BACT|nr:hypothetical protein PRLR5003_04930 [Prevotella lacticifex]GJG39613.1 hypothetical protein PRLR5019_15840 [Prevotella lacticifex]GJG41705.1 hypothetical protein PRLR5025_04910 [Prevotella lacticifex]GJG45969.1 hypothetical protein PRLR5027_15640 [Prevotella lacticifex]GJG48056.1 hypothetical protein PRLR5052_04690 [Prevotella lacticifex]
MDKKYEIEELVRGDILDGSLMEIVTGGVSSKHSAAVGECSYSCVYTMCNYSACSYNFCQYGFCRYDICKHAVCALTIAL